MVLMSENNIKRYALCGVSARGIHMFLQPMYRTFPAYTQPVALLEIDPLRFAVCKGETPEAADLPEYRPEEFEKMLEETRPDVIIATGVDCTHVDYILKALAHDLDVITEKPMATTGEDCRKIVEAEKRSKGKVTCTFNFRYPPVHRRMRELILEDKIGRITNIDLTWYVDTKHGSSYFNRWNRMRENSGGLSIHKSSHHFDLVNWLIDGVPEAVHAFGGLYYYGPESPYNPEVKDGRLCESCTDRLKCAYFRRWSTRQNAIDVPDDHIGSFTVGKKNQYTDYRPDRCIFDSEINIEDTYIANVRYKGGALLNYSCNFSLPYEGYRLAINGTKGRLETQEWHAPARTPFPVDDRQYVDYFPLFGSRERYWAVPEMGSHNGGDPLIREDLFIGPDPDRPYKMLSGAEDAWHSVAIGEAVWRSIKEEKIIKLDFSTED